MDAALSSSGLKIGSESNHDRLSHYLYRSLLVLGLYYIFWAYYAKIKFYGENSKGGRKEDKRMTSSKRDGLIYKSNKYTVGKCEDGDKSSCRKFVTS